MAGVAGLLYEAEIRHDHSNNAASLPYENMYYQCESEMPLRLRSPGDVPASPVTSSQTSLTPRLSRLRARLIKFYTKHNPSAIPRVDQILERYHGREAELWHDLCQKYITNEGGVFVGSLTIRTRFGVLTCIVDDLQRWTKRSSLDWEILSFIAC